MVPERLESRSLLAADFNDELREAGTLTPTKHVEAQPFSAEIWTDDDVDIYRFSVSKGTIIDFDLDTVENGVGGLDGYLRLFDQEGNELAANNNATAITETRLGSDAFLRYTFRKDGTYYIGVSNATNIRYDPIKGTNDVMGGKNSTGKYTLDIELAGDYPDVGNSIATAEKFSYPGFAVKGRLMDVTDVDIYAIFIPDTILVDINVDTYSRESEGVNTYLRLFDEQGNQLASNNDAIGPGDTQASIDPYIRFQFINNVHSRRYAYIAVSHSYHTDYDPHLAFANADSAQKFYHLRVTPVYEDANDTRYSAVPLNEITTVPVTKTGSVRADISVTLYSLDVQTGQTISFDIDTPLNGIGNLNSYLRLFDQVGTELASNDNAASPDEATLGFDAYLRYTFQVAGKYYIGVSNYNNIQYETSGGGRDTAGGLHSIGDYTLTVVQTQSNPIDTNDAIDEALIFGDVSTQRHGVGAVINEDRDVDMFRFEIPLSALTVDFVMSESAASPVGMRTYMRLFNASGVELSNGGLIPTRSAAAAYFRYVFSSPGTYYLGVSSSDNTGYDPVTGNGDQSNATGSVGKYGLSIYALEKDLNDEKRESTQLDLPAAINSQKTDMLDEDIDVDLFGFIAMADQTIAFNVETGLNTFLRLFSSDGRELAFNDDRPSPERYQNPLSSYLQYTFDTPGIYYIGVSNAPNRTYDINDGSGDTAGGGFGSYYTLFVRSLTQSFIDTDDTLSEAVSIGSVTVAEKVIEDKIEGPVDTDIISFTVTAGQQVSFDIDTVGGVLSYLRLFDAAGVQLASNTQTAGPYETGSSYYDAYLVYTFATAGTYYLGTSSFFHTDYNPLTGADGHNATGYSYGSYRLAVQTAIPYPGSELELTFTSSFISEAGGQTTGIIRRAWSDITNPLTVSISTSANNAAIAPTEVFLPAGNVGMLFSITAIYDPNQGTRRATFTIQAPGFQPVSRSLLITDIDGVAHNGELPTDTNGDSVVTPMDALLIVNHLNTTGGDEVPPKSQSYLDVSADGLVTSIDALLVINRLNNPRNAEGETAATTARPTPNSAAVDSIMSYENYPLIDTATELRKQRRGDVARIRVLEKVFEY